MNPASGATAATTPGAATDRARAPCAPRLGYLLKVFPRLSETFILNEVLELERQGIDLRIYSMNEPSEPVTHRLFQRVRTGVSYLPYPLLASWRTYLGAHARLACRHPLRWLLTLLFVLASFDRDLLERFVQAGELVRRLRRDGVTHLHAGFVHFPGSVAWIVHRITGMPFSLATHARDVWLSRPGLLRRKLCAAQVVFTCSVYNVPHLHTLAGPRGIRRLRQIYHGVDLERFRFEPHGKTDPPLILSIGRLVAKKGFDHLIAACALLRDRGHAFRCQIIAGSRDLLPQLTAQIRELGLDLRVTIVGPLDQDEVRVHYAQAAVFALPCVVADDGDRDGIPNVLVEAAAVGVPIVTTPTSGITELVVDGVTGLLVPPRDRVALADAIDRLLASPELCAQLRTRARRRIEEQYDLRRNAVQVAQEFARLTAPPVTAVPRIGRRSARERVS